MFLKKGDEINPDSGSNMLPTDIMQIFKTSHGCETEEAFQESEWTPSDIPFVCFFRRRLEGNGMVKKIKERRLHFNSTLSPPSSSTDPVWRRLWSFYST